jgi:hypothetical protein
MQHMRTPFIWSSMKMHPIHILHEHVTTWNWKKTRHGNYIDKKDQFQSAIMINLKIKAKTSKEKHKKSLNEFHQAS